MSSRKSNFTLEDHENRLVWIFGSSRSGSTWLLRMLSDLNGVVTVDDPHLGHHLGVWRPISLAWAACDEPPELTTLLDLKADEPDYFFADRYRDSWRGPLRSLIQSRFEAQVEDSGEIAGLPTVVVKEPGSHAAPLLADLFPESKLIFLLRDGRDVVDSWLAAYQDGSWAIPGGAFPVSAEGRIPLIRWLCEVWAYRSRAVRRAFDSRRPPDRILIRYETLRARTPEALSELCERLQLDRNGFSDVAERHRFDQAPRALRGPHQEIRSARPGSWRENLTPTEQMVMRDCLGDALEEFGYGADDDLAAENRHGLLASA